MRKRAALFLIILLLTQPLFSLAEVPGADTQRLLLSSALSLCETMDACADDPEYAKLYPANVREAMGLIGRQDWASPKAARLYVIKERLFSVYLSASSVDEAALSAPARKKLREAIPSSLTGLINTEQTAFPSAAGALRCGGVLPQVPADTPEWCLIYLTFDGSYDALCSFVKTDSGCVSAYLSAVQKDGIGRLLSQLRRAFIREQDIFEAYDIQMNP